MTSVSPALTPLCLHQAYLRELDPDTLYALLRLRVDVFVAEQECAYSDLDGRDTDPQTRHVWFSEREGAPVSYLRTLDGSAGTRIGRVVTAPAYRGRGIANRLLTATLADIDARLGGVEDGVVRLDAQTHTVGLYHRHGFEVEGAQFLDDGIPHVPMVRRTP